MQIELIVLFGVKTHGAIVAALHNVLGNANIGEARSAEHGGGPMPGEEQRLSEISVVCPRLCLQRKLNLTSDIRKEH